MIIDVKSQAAVVQKEAVKEFSLQDVARKVNNVNLDEEIVVVQQVQTPMLNCNVKIP